MAMVVTPFATNSIDLVEEATMADERAQPEAFPAPLASTPTPASPKQGRGSALHHVGSRVYDRQNWISCHQCRQKTRNSTVSCKNIKKKDKPCCIRYGENALEAYAKENWECSKCRGICNCSVCM